MKNLFIRTVAFVSLAAGLFAIVQSCTESQGKSASIPRASDPVPVRIVSLEKSSTNDAVITSGRLTTDDETLLSFKTGGVVSGVFVKEGDRVAKGQVLATLDLTEVDAAVSGAKAALDKAERDLQRTKNLFRDSVATLEQLQNAETAFDVANQQFKAAAFNHQFSRITAPASGYVLRRYINAGQVVGVGDPILRTNGAGDGKWILRAGVSDRDWSTIQLGDQAEISVDAFPGETFGGVVIRRSETADPATGAFTIEIAIQAKQSRFASGMFASAKIVGSETTTSWSVPYEAVLDANGNEGFVFVTTDKKVAIRKPVVIGTFDGNSIRIKSGLDGSESLIVSGSAYLTDQSPIQVIQ